MRRATIADLREHDWFKRDLPPYLFPENDLNLLIPDEEAIQETCEKFNAEPAELRKILEEQDTADPLAVAYRLIIDNKRKSDEHVTGAPLVDYK